ncbi:MAG: dihydrodipicolinate reductase C-terminal domain-containing protein [Devosia sp.]|nr:dihydrodipicolinate reductase C-terminal domain-containing protein [Devosia sp.]
MRIAIYGASGRIGTRLVETILARPDLELAAAHVSPSSSWLGRAVGGTIIEYRPAEAAINAYCDAIIDFSTPEASLQLQELLGSKPVPVVIGTTGFSAAQQEALANAAKLRPIMLGANFGPGFGAFATSVFRFAQLHPGALVTVDETYHQRKKRVASGTSLQLAQGIRDIQTRMAGALAPEPDVHIHRLADTVGINQVQFDMGVTKASFTFAVNTLTAYAEGALSAAEWLSREARGPRLYAPSDMWS